MQIESEKLPHYVGHRKRQKDKFLKNHPSSFSDYELVELILFQSIPRKDVKPLAKELLNKFGNLNNLVNSNKENLSEVEGTNQSIFMNLQVIKELISRVLASQVMNQNVIGSWSALLGMTTTTFIIGFIPNYSEIGYSAPVLLVMMRLIQGLCISGEGAGAAIFILEHYQNLRPGFTAGIVNASNIAGTLLASVVGIVLELLFPGMEFVWR